MVTPGSYLYKHFKRIVANWPVDTSKSQDRNLRFTLEKRLQDAFQPAVPGTSGSGADNKRLQPEINPLECKKRLEGLFAIISTVGTLPTLRIKNISKKVPIKM
jgi:hypothetical protein